MSHDKQFKDWDILAKSFRATQVRVDNFACYPPRSYNHVLVDIRGGKNPLKKKSFCNLTDSIVTTPARMLPSSLGLKNDRVAKCIKDFRLTAPMNEELNTS